ncbi:DUF1827 family protein [Enterococcus sp. N342-3-1-2]
MKLIETPVNQNLNMESFYPNISKFIFDKTAVKLYKIYALDRTQILYVDTYDQISLVLINNKKKISREEVDTGIHRLLKVDRSQVTVNVTIRKEMEAKGIVFSQPRKDIILVQLPIA